MLIVAPPLVTLMDVTGPWEVFCRAEAYVPGSYDVAIVAAEHGGRVRTKFGLDIVCDDSVHDHTGTLDTVLVAGSEQGVSGDADPAFLAWLRDASDRTRRMGSICTGAFYLAHAGVLGKRNVTTHWRYTDRLAARFPELMVDPEPVFISDGDMHTSAGITAGIDLALALVEADCGHTVSQQIAQDLVLFIQRHGEQAQLSWSLAQRSADRDPIRQLQRWAPDNLPLLGSVDDMAARVHMSPRNFARLFKQQTGISPGTYLRELRAEAARRRVVQAPRKSAALADELGFGSGKSLQRNVRARCTSSSNEPTSGPSARGKRRSHS
ncbi:MAG TPA: AraC family transcriptional regulator [Pseudomonadales bacterium]